jgi:DNA invertase Pin-like site-specific DNA recombinase
MATENRKAFAYLRVSGLGQVDGDGFPRQRHAIARYARANRITLVDEFMEEGVSGCTDWDAREGLAALLDRLDANGVRLVLVERADRVARDLMVSEVLLNQFRERGVAVVECEGGQELTVADQEPTRILIRQVLAAVSQFERSCLVRKLRAARDRKRPEHRRCEGPLGFGAGPAKPAEAATVARMRALKAERVSLSMIAATLNAEGLPTRQGRKWSKQSVAHVLARPTTPASPAATAAPVAAPPA